MADAFVIELRNLTAGIAVRERGGYRFYCSDNLFFPLDDRKFRRLREIRFAVNRIIDGAGLLPPRTGTRVAGHGHGAGQRTLEPQLV